MLETKMSEEKIVQNDARKKINFLKNSRLLTIC